MYEDDSAEVGVTERKRNADGQVEVHQEVRKKTASENQTNCNILNKKTISPYSNCVTSYDRYFE